MTMLMIKMINDDDNDEDLSVPARALPKSPVPRTVTASPSSLVDNYYDHDSDNDDHDDNGGDNHDHDTDNHDDDNSDNDDHDHGIDNQELLHRLTLFTIIMMTTIINYY